MLRFNMHTNTVHPVYTFITLQVFDDVVSVRWSAKFKVDFKLLKNVLTISTRKEGSRHRINKR